jgi:hypothetical protein
MSSQRKGKLNDKARYLRELWPEGTAHASATGLGHEGHGVPAQANRPGDREGGQRGRGSGSAEAGSLGPSDGLSSPRLNESIALQSVLIDLVEPGVAPAIHHRQIPGQTITDEKTYVECSPNVVIAIAKQEMP